jgi:predicted Fe-Mo cluster-binding NifX family protein
VFFVFKYDFWDTLYNNQIILFIIIKIIMKKRIAIPLENGVLCSHFGHCKQFAIVDAENNSISGETLVTPPPHEPGLLPAWLAEKGVTDVIAGGMGQRAIDLFNNQKINVFVGAQVKNYSDLANDLINGSLVAGANYCDH